ncbi:bifunctional ADP-dependent NAD(P)H-hydrate dehydratase/NAD(P)H-hydrate epimerase [Geitlerinema sp. PCC 9228]|jgi:NAD(P)H-hydrate epimerase|uniref:bifunctional ADP-dependent NAD(P)H-hydrate dehydratase/NAD(P)H-hydrate epimerase n=1 Tax=Geitlerinema sp. PCC 9228 TaxID=111611 RepID=UPI0008F9C170|nr:bifunctional ADP-dependent NAD(P)H-hydrate dehydratase/NAD(P)H-hydrate epimerase [Geitlerinema sp. PCC 9228]
MRSELLQQLVATAQQVRSIEQQAFDAGMPVAALMEKAAVRVAQRIQILYPLTAYPRVGVLIGPGHNGGDALVVARELHLQGYQVRLHRPGSKLKDLPAAHAQYAKYLGIQEYDDLFPLRECEFLVDGLFGFGMTKTVRDPYAQAIAQVNQWPQPIASIDMPAGLHTDTGEPLKEAIRAARTFCLGVWKPAFFQDRALAYVGRAELIDIGLPEASFETVLGHPPALRLFTPNLGDMHLPLQRPQAAHKYQMGHLLLVCGSRQYTGAPILAGLGARHSGVGMLSMAVPQSLQLWLSAQIPEALVVGLPEDADTGAATADPNLLEKVGAGKYQAIAIGPGLTPNASNLVQEMLKSDRPMVVDADGLNVLAQLGSYQWLQARTAATILTPHPGEFKRLFPDLTDELERDRIIAAQKAAQTTGATIVLKGARTVTAYPNGQVFLNPHSTPALARGGSGDVLTGLLGGLVAHGVAQSKAIEPCVPTAVWWHALAGEKAASERTEMGVDAFTLTQYLLPAITNSE